MEKTSVKLSIVIVTMNHLEKLKNLLHSLCEVEDISVSHEIIIVDNCSTDDTVAYVKEYYPTIFVHQNEGIKGFAANNNQGYSLSKGELIFICNPDIIILPGSIETLISYYEKSPSVGIVCPQLLNSDKTYQTSVRRFHNLKILLLRILFWGNDASKNKTVQQYLMNEFDKSKIQKVDWALGAAMVLSRKIYQKLAGFDEHFFLYVEDVDLCLRTWKLGYNVIYNPEAVMIHDHQRVSSKTLNAKTWLHFKSMVYFFFKHNLFFKEYHFLDGK